MKLAITLCHLTTGDSYATLQYDLRVARNTISLLVKDVCEALVLVLKNEMIICPLNSDTWHKTAEEFKLCWTVQHACGALVCKHVAIRNPPKSGSIYHNYKGFNCIVLMALVGMKTGWLGLKTGLNCFKPYKNEVVLYWGHLLAKVTLFQPDPGLFHQFLEGVRMF